MPRFHDPAREWRRIFSEAWGTFLLVLFASGSSAMHRIAPDQVSAAMATSAPGLTVMVVIYLLGAVGGAHLNPAVTLAFATRRNFPWRKVPSYLGAQFIGACAAAAVLRSFLGTGGELGATHPGSGLALPQALVIEIVLTAGLVHTILATASGARNVGPNAAVAVGGYIAVAGFWADGLSGASMNPARSLAPDILRGDIHETWVYVIGPLIGAMIAVGFEWILVGAPTAAGTRAAQGEAEESRNRE